MAEARIAEAEREVLLLAGNHAIARGAYEAGVKVASGYPGTPSTEILETLVKEAGVDVRWSPNEKVGFDVALGASFGGARALVTMKHVGLNVAADSFMTAAYTGVGAGLVVSCADDPGMHSSQNEQDSRIYARFAGVPLLEPSDSAEAKEYTKQAFSLSEEFDTPVMLRTTTRVAHNRGVVEPGRREEHAAGGFVRDPGKYVMLPGHARQRHTVLLERLERLTAYANRSPLVVESGSDGSVGLVTAGICYHYVREVLPEAKVLKLGISFPLPIERIRRFAASVDRLLVVEELEPVIEDAIRAAGIAVEGKAFFSRTGELGPDAVADGLAHAGVIPPRPAPDLGPVAMGRPPLLCPGCPHTAPFLALKHLDAVVAGDIGCYTLAALEPLSAMDTCIAMGASIGTAVGLAASGGAGGSVVATIGDSTFLHGGIQGLMDAVYADADITVLILDNGTVAMTGGQPHPGTGITMAGASSRPVDIVALCKALGVKDVRVVDPYDVSATYRTMQAAMAHSGPSVVITNRPCVEAPVKVRDHPYEVIAESCIACQACQTLGCPAILWTDEIHEGRRKVMIDPVVCTGCTLCAQVCFPRAIVPVPASATVSVTEPEGAANG